MDQTNKSKKRTAVPFITLAVLFAFPFAVKAVADHTAFPTHLQHLFQKINPDPKPKPGAGKIPLKAGEDASVELLENGTILEQGYKEGVRTEKVIRDEKGEVLKRWVFDPKHKRIQRFEDYTYESQKLVRYRIASWDYRNDGSFEKKNILYDGQKARTGSFTEFVNDKKIKYREEWYNADGQLSGKKLWDPQNGAFDSHFTIRHLPNGWSLETHYSASGKAIRKMIYTPEGEPWRTKILNIERMPIPEGTQ